MSNRFTRWLRLAIAIVGLAVLGAPVISQTAAAAPTCNVSWGSQEKSGKGADPRTAGDIANLRSGRQQCYDRVVIDISGQAGGYQVKYVPAVRSDTTGERVPLRGRAALEVRVSNPAYNDAGKPTWTPRDRNNVVNVSGYQTLRQIAYVSSVHSQTQIGVGVRARLPFRVMIIKGTATDRLVIDIAHRW